jgi:hypothetical protein
MKACRNCTDLLKATGLTAAEQKLTMTDVKDLPAKLDPARHHLILRVAGKALLVKGKGFVTVWGPNGSGKSQWGKALAADAARAGMPARYIMGKDLERYLFNEGPKTRQGEETMPGIPDHLRRAQVLIVDEVQGANWKSEWVERGLQPFLDGRYRMGEGTGGVLTVLISQTDPSLEINNWAPPWLYSRMRDGAQAIPWPQDVSAPPSITDGMIRWPFHVAGMDIRPHKAVGA